MIDCYLQANSTRPQFLLQAIKSIDSQTIFNRKVIHIAGGTQLHSEIYDHLYKNNWDIFASHTYRVGTFKTMIGEFSSEYVFYIEDDIELKSLPVWIPEMLDTYKPGILSLNLGGSTCDYPNGRLGDLIHINDRVLCIRDSLTLFKRDYSMRNNYYFEFPCLFMNREMLQEMLPNIKGEEIEVSLSNAYNLLDKNKYYKTSLCSSAFLDRLSVDESISNFSYEMEKAKLYKLLDPKQGGVDWDLSLLQ